MSRKRVEGGPPRACVLTLADGVGTLRVNTSPQMVFTRVNTSLIQVLYTLGALSIYCAHPPDAILTLVPGPVRPLRPLMLAASPEVLDPKKNLIYFDPKPKVFSQILKCHKI